MYKFLLEGVNACGTILPVEGQQDKEEGDQRKDAENL